LVITEIPYQVNKASLVERIAELVREKKIQGVADLRDESDREGMRIVLELKKETAKEVILNQLYKWTPLESSFGAILLVLVNNEPKVLGLKGLLERFLEFRLETVTKRTRFELAKAEERAHILEGLKVALSNIDAVIELIKRSKDTESARQGLMQRFKLSQRQAEAILEMRLARLTGLEREKIDEEYKGLIKEIARLKSLLESKRLMMGEIRNELLEVKKRFADERRTEILLEEPKDVSIEDLIKEEDMAVTITHRGYIKRMAVSVYRRQNRGGQGSTGVPHAVLFVPDAEAALVQTVGAELRYHAHFAPRGTNVNFVQVLGPSSIRVRTYERGVEAETLACGTGVTASALIAARLHKFDPPVKVRVQSGDVLEVDFRPVNDTFTDVKLTGPAQFVFEGTIEL
ncbi:MAG: diaminopimelate epimerase, partial [candidate division WOR-3 bacterium]